MRTKIYFIFFLVITIGAFLAFLMKANISYVPRIEETGTAFIFDFISKEDDKDEAEDLKERFLSAREGKGKIKIVVVPGHEVDYGGAKFRGLKEREINVELSKYIYDFFKEDQEFEVFLARNEESFHPELEEYFREEWESIEKFIEQSRNKMDKLTASGKVKLIDGVPHNDIAHEGAVRLYGISKWANENDIDILIHNHFNDYPRARYDKAGEYSGFSIYIPERQYSNSMVSLAIAESIFDNLIQYYPKSNLPKEDQGIVEDQKLIAIGRNNTLDSAVVLIEYGYIYEPQFQYKEIRDVVLKELAYQTYRGIIQFFDEYKVLSYSESLLLQSIDKNLQYKMKNKTVLQLQLLLTQEGVLPPPGFSRYDCGLDGIFGKCTLIAVKEFQRKYGLVVDGIVGYQTRKKLDELYLPIFVSK